jgi:hypothetical protein
MNYERGTMIYERKAVKRSVEYAVQVSLAVLVYRSSIIDDRSAFFVHHSSFIVHRCP